MGTIPALKDKNGSLAYLKTHWIWWFMIVILAFGVGTRAEAGGLPSVKASLGNTVLVQSGI